MRFDVTKMVFALQIVFDQFWGDEPDSLVLELDQFARVESLRSRLEEL